MFSKDDRAANNRGQEAESFMKDFSEADIIFVVQSLIEQNSELASKVEETSYVAKVAQEQVAESVRQRDMCRMEATRIMAEAQQLADRTFKEKVVLAEQEAKGIIKSAEAEAEEIKRLAEQQAKSIIDEAKHIADKDRHAAQKNRKEAEIEARTAEVVALGESSDKVSPEEDKEQHWQRYIWDSTKLAWVQAPELAISQPLQEVPNEPNIVEAGKRSIEQKQSVSTTEREAKDHENKVKLYKGPIEVVVKSRPMSGELRNFGRHLRDLKRAQDIRVLKVGSAGKDIVIRLFLKSPIPLLDILKALPEVHTVYDNPKDVGETQRSRFKPDRPIATSIMVKLTR